MSARTLQGRRVAVTRAREQSPELGERLRALGAEVIELPLIAVKPAADRETLNDVFAELGGYDWAVFTSANGVNGFFDEFLARFDDIRALGLLRFAAVGDATAAAIRGRHIRIDCQPEVATAEALADALIATGSLDRENLIKKLEEARAIVDRCQVYRTDKTDLAADPAAADFRARGADAVLFASSSAVQSFVDQAAALKLAKDARRPLAGSIGPQTSETMRKAGLPVDFEAATPGLDALVAALVKKLGA
jgi:uroporphyrinogen-III synthase